MRNTTRHIRQKETVETDDYYIDRWDLDGEFYQGGCFLYYEGETLRDYCDRNGEPYPVRRIPEEVIEMFESGDFSQIKRWRKEVPELNNCKV